jgi:uncharacterized protein
LLRVFLSVIFMSLMGCSSFLYYPSNALYINPKKLKHVPEDVEIQVKKDQSIRGWYFHTPVKPARAVVLFFHGNAENRSTHFMALYWLIDKGYDLAIFDYPGYGQSDDEPTPKNTVAMAVETLRYVHNRDPNLPLVVYGQSLGGAISMRGIWEVRNEFKPDLIIMDSTFPSYRSVVRRILSRSAWTWLLQPIGWAVMSDTWAPGKRISDLKGTPIVVIHSKMDEVVPVEAGKEIYDYAGEPKQLWLKEKGSHMGTYAGSEGELLKRKLLKILPGGE